MPTLLTILLHAFLQTIPLPIMFICHIVYHLLFLKPLNYSPLNFSGFHSSNFILSCSLLFNPFTVHSYICFHIQFSFIHYIQAKHPNILFATSHSFCIQSTSLDPITFCLPYTLLKFPFPSVLI